MLCTGKGDQGVIEPWHVVGFAHNQMDGTVKIYPVPQEQRPGSEQHLVVVETFVKWLRDTPGLFSAVDCDEVDRFIKSVAFSSMSCGYDHEGLKKIVSWTTIPLLPPGMPN